MKKKGKRQNIVVLTDSLPIKEVVKNGRGGRNQIHDSQTVT
jgi:hypothetical protein